MLVHPIVAEQESPIAQHHTGQTIFNHAILLSPLLHGHDIVWGAGAAVRDKKGMAFIVLVPLVAVSLVMLILSINIDPTSPTMTLRLEDMLPGTTIPLSQAPQPLAHCTGSPCGSAHTFEDWPAGSSSYTMSQLLLQVRCAMRLFLPPIWMYRLSCEIVLSF